MYQENRNKTNLPHETSDWFLTDGGLETTLVFHQNWELPHFAAFDLLRSKMGYQALRDYYERYCKLAEKYRTHFILESPTWRANPDWASRLGYSTITLDQANRMSIAMLKAVRAEYETNHSRFLISGCIGPRGDGYAVHEKMDVEQAKNYHQEQITTFHLAEVDMISGITMTYAEEAIGIVKAAESLQIPSVISFTLETNGRLPSGQLLKEAIQQVDESTKNSPVYYMINCAHPQHFLSEISDHGSWMDRIRGIRANASTKSHAELDASETLEEGNPVALGNDYKALNRLFKNLNVIGGCCGTDHRHVEEMCKAVVYSTSDEVRSTR